MDRGFWWMPVCKAPRPESAQQLTRYTATTSPKPVFASFTASSPTVSPNGSLSLGVACPKGGTGCTENVSLTVTTVGGKIASATALKKKPKPTTVKIASGQIKLAAGKKGTIKLKLSRTGLNPLKQAKGHKLKVSAVITAGKTTEKKTLTLKLAPTKKSKK